MAGFTKTEDTVAPCYGTNHRDYGVIGICDGCGTAVAKRDDSKVYDIEYKGVYSARKIVCWHGTHRCDPERAALYAANQAEKVADGIIVKGCTVEVFKGRKIPIGTTGTVFWKGIDGYGKKKIGIRTKTNETIFLAESNCRPI